MSKSVDISESPMPALTWTAELDEALPAHLDREEESGTEEQQRASRRRKFP
jgi:hypothetical protein